MEMLEAKETVMFYPVLSPEIGSYFLACVYQYISQ